jgi:hypothetical protein
MITRNFPHKQSVATEHLWGSPLRVSYDSNVNVKRNTRQLLPYKYTAQ